MDYQTQPGDAFGHNFVMAEELDDDHLYSKNGDGTSDDDAVRNKEIDDPHCMEIGDGASDDDAVRNKENTVCLTTKRRQAHPSRTATHIKISGGQPSIERILLFWLLLTKFTKQSCASNTVVCFTEQYIRLWGRAVVKCDGLEDFPSIYWFNSTNEDATAFVQKVNGEVTGPGYTSGDFNIDNEGSLVINNVTIRDEQTFRVRVLDSSLIASGSEVTVTVYVEPEETIPVVPECSGQSTCVLKGELDRVILCIHGESRPAMEVSWFLRVGREDRLLDAIVNQIMSANSVTFTTSAQLAIKEIPIDANMNQLVVLVCKSNQPVPGAKGAQLVVLLDNSVDDPFTNEGYLDPVYAFEREEDFKIKCQSEIDTANNVVLWMYKILNSEDFENILYSAYGEVAFTEENSGFNITDDGGLVIKEVDLQNEGHYACVSSSETTTVSFGQNLEVIVLPQPPRIVVKGCEPFQPCHLSGQEAETITCTVNGVRPLVDLSIVISSMNVAVIKTTVNSHLEDGLFYMTVTGQVDISKATCGKNVTVICQAQGPAAYGFMSDVHITLPVGRADCAESSTEKTDDVVGYNGRQDSTIVVIVMFVAGGVLLLLVIVGVSSLCNIRSRQNSGLYNGSALNQCFTAFLTRKRESLPNYPPNELNGSTCCDQQQEQEETGEAAGFVSNSKDINNK